ncbi:hypothetical protein CYMTET_26095 [Cymbomonas tetramitiformis]|uniref:EF-hand domain-containing protein n=1 Tax=Cymbomonas tetramitiformis TaxID=36881 RepID=A0AAE0KYE0_9CHLO|nr:hypothetical protein CYMTET_26095 [Cymbomonas tetramitiformis]
MAFYGSTSQSIQYFNDLGKPLPEFVNPAEHILDCTNAEYTPMSLPNFWKFRRLWVFYRSLPIVFHNSTGDHQMQLLQLTGYLLMVTMTLAIPPLKTFAERVLSSDRTFKSFLEIFADFSGCIDLANLGDFNLQDLLQREMSASFDANKGPGKNLIIAITEAANQLSDTRWIRNLHTEFAFRCEGHKGNIGIKDSAQSQHAMFSLTRVEALDVFKVMGFDKVFGQTMCEAILDIVISIPHNMPAEIQPSDDTIPYFEITRFLILLISQMMPDDEIDELCSERFFYSADTDRDGELSVDELAEVIGQLFLVDFIRFVPQVGQARFKQMVVKPMHTLLLAAAPGDQVTYRHYKNFMEMRIALREHVKESAGTSSKNLVDGYANAEDLQRMTAEPMTLGFLAQLDILCRRGFYAWSRDSQMVKSVITLAIALPFIISILYINAEISQEKFQDVASLCFISLITSMSSPLSSTVLAFPAERAIVMREYTNGCYDILPFYISKIILLITTRCLSSIVLSFMLYFFVELHAGGANFDGFMSLFGVLFSIVIFACMTGLSLGIIR